MSTSSGELFREEQRLLQGGLGVVIGVVLTAAFVGLIAAWLVQAHAPARAASAHPAGLPRVWMVVAVTCSPLREYGGWGIRGFGSNRACNVSGNRGVRLVFRDGKRLLLGSQRADELDAAITSAAGRP